MNAMPRWYWPLAVAWATYTIFTVLLAEIGWWWWPISALLLQAALVLNVGFKYDNHYVGKI